MLLETYNEALAACGAEVMRRRAEYLDRLAPLAAANYRDISSGAEALALRYLPCCDPTPEALAAKLRAVRAAELRAGFCLAGPHREDLEILLDGQPGKIYGSQGQQRSAVLAMKLAEATVAGDVLGEHPVMLLDDVLSELDDARQTYLLTPHRGQADLCDHLRLRRLRPHQRQNRARQRRRSVGGRGAVRK